VTATSDTWHFDLIEGPGAEAAAEDAPGGPDLAERYALLGELGRGAMGAVYRARERRSGREVALKVLQGRLDAERRERFRREGELAASLRHPGIVAVHSTGAVAGRPYLACELVPDARDLEAALAEGDLGARVALLRDVATAVGHAHARGVVHRDLKPANVLVDRAGRARVTDFGLAWSAGLDSLTKTGALLGTPRYMAPEQLVGERAGPAADVWALGVMLYEALADAHPFPAETLFALRARVGEPPEPLRGRDPAVPPALEAVALRCLVPEPGRRYPDAAALAADLDAALAGRPLALRPTGGARRRVLLAAGLVTLAGAGLAAGGLAATGPGPDAPPPAATAAAAPPPAEAAPAPLDPARAAEAAALLAEGRRQAALRARAVDPAWALGGPPPAARAERAREALRACLALDPSSAAAAAALASLDAPPPRPVPDRRPAAAEARFQETLTGQHEQELTPEGGVAAYAGVVALDPFHWRGRYYQGKAKFVVGGDAAAGCRDMVAAARHQPALLGDLFADLIRVRGAGEFFYPGDPAMELAAAGLTQGDDRLGRLTRATLHAATVELDGDPVDRLLLRDLDALLAEDPGEALAWVLRGFLRLRAGRLEAARRDLATARDAAPLCGPAPWYQLLLRAVAEEPPERLRDALKHARGLGYMPWRERGWNPTAYPELAPYVDEPGLEALRGRDLR